MVSDIANVTLPIARLHLDFEAATEGALPDPAGPSWRGGFGWALRRLSCPQPDRDPAACACDGPCAWRLVFDTPRPAGATKMRLYETIPHPFALDAQGASGRMRTGEPASLRLALIGSAQRHAHVAAQALAMAGEAGIGEARTRFRLRAILRETAPAAGVWVPFDPAREPAESDEARPPAAPRGLRVELATPLQLRAAEAPVRPEGFTFGRLARALLRRVSLLSTFHAGRDLDLDFRGLVAAADAVVPARVALRWQGGWRQSRRGGVSHPLGGLVGAFELDGEAWRPFWPLLWFGGLVQAGKGTSMGFGKLVLAPAGA